MAPEPLTLEPESDWQGTACWLAEVLAKNAMHDGMRKTCGVKRRTELIRTVEQALKSFEASNYVSAAVVRKHLQSTITCLKTLPYERSA